MDPNKTTQITQLLIRRRRSAILAADVAGYSALMGTDEERTLKRLDAARSIMDSRIAQLGGRIANTAGDSVIAEFPNAVAAVRCAVEVQTALRQRNAGLPPPERLQFRIGINYGEVMANRADLLGDNVNVAARIENLATPGGVLISASTHEQVYGRLDVGFRALGEQALKNISRKVEVYEVLLDGDARPTGKPATAQRSATTQRSTASSRSARVAPPPEQRRAWPLVAALGFVVLVAIGAIGYLVMTQLMPGRPPAPASSAPASAAPASSPPATTGAAAPAVPDLARLTAAANAAVAGFSCARLGATVTAPTAIAVAGYVGAAADAKAAVARVAAVPGAGPVTQQIAVLPPPLCQALDQLPAKAVLAANAPAGPQINVGGNSGVYRDGDHLLITVTAAADGYLYVAYLDSGDNLFIHMLPNDIRNDSHVVAGQQVVIGEALPEIVRYGVMAPFGTDLVLALATREPLFTIPNSRKTSLPEFLPKLAAAVQAQPDLLVAYAPVITKPKQ